MKDALFIDKDEVRYSLSEGNLEVLKKVAEMNSRLGYVSRDWPESFGNVLIFGLQRSGTTLAYQIFANSTELGYINNLIARFWEDPQYGVYLWRHLDIPRSISFQSSHGRTSGITDVHEFGYFWSSLLNAKSNPSLGAIEPGRVDWQLLRNKILSINHAYNSACIYKNTLAGHFLPYLHRILPTTLFIHLRRDFLEIAVSILKVRKQRYGSIDHWWSMKPVEYEQIKGLDPFGQVAGQIYFLNQDLERQKRLVPPENLLEITYDELCENPGEVLAKTSRKAGRIGIEINVSNEVKVPLQRSVVSSTGDDIEDLCDNLDKFSLPYKNPAGESKEK